MTVFFILMIIVLLALFWWDGMASKEMARNAGSRACQVAGVQFLDDTVALAKLRLRRASNGRLKFYRLYRFEFASDGEFRYHGAIHMLGSQLQNLEMDPYKIKESPVEQSSESG